MFLPWRLITSWTMIFILPADTIGGIAACILLLSMMIYATVSVISYALVCCNRCFGTEKQSKESVIVRYDK